MEIALLVLRLVVGLTFVVHAAQKLFRVFVGQGIESTADHGRPDRSASEQGSMRGRRGWQTSAAVDRIFELRLGVENGPFRRMDGVGLDVVLDIEEHYAAVREGIPEARRRLLREFIDKGWFGVESGRGLYDECQPEP